MTVTVSIPWPTLSMSSRILSPAEMLATDVTLMLVAPAGASAPRKACVPGLPTAVTVATSYFSIGFRDGGIGGAIADGDLLADREAGHARDRHVGRAGGDRDHRTVGKGLPQRRVGAGRRPDACDLAGLHAGAGVDARSYRRPSCRSCS